MKELKTRKRIHIQIIENVIWIIVMAFFLLAWQGL